MWTVAYMAARCSGEMKRGVARENRIESLVWGWEVGQLGMKRFWNSTSSVMVERMVRDREL